MELCHGAFVTRTGGSQRYRTQANPMGTVSTGEGGPVVILNRNEPTFYCVLAKAFEALMEKVEDLELNAIADSRAGQKEIPVMLDAF